jgi:hypothetical protein
MAIYETKIGGGPYEPMEIIIKIGNNISDPTEGTALVWDNQQSAGNIFFDTPKSFRGTLLRNLPNPDGPMSFEGTLVEE